MATVLQNYWKRYATSRRLLEDATTEFTANGTTSYYTSLLNSVLGEVQLMRGYFWNSIGFVQDPALDPVNNFRTTELSKFLTDFSEYVPQWSGMGYDMGRSNRSPYPIQNELAVYSSTSIDIGGEVYSSPVVGSNGTVYTADITGMVTAGYYNRLLSTFTSVGSFSSGVTGYASLSIGMDGTIYLYNSSGLTALRFDSINFSQMWTYSFPGGSSSPIIGKDGTIYNGATDGYVYAINPDGTLKWKVRSATETTGSPSIGPDGTVYVGASSGIFYAINQSTGQTIATITLSGSITNSPVIDTDGSIYIGTSSVNMYILKLILNPIGNKDYIFTTLFTYGGFAGGVYCTPPAIDSDGTVYVGTSNGYLYAFNKNSNASFTSRQINLDTSPTITSQLLVYQGNLVLADYSGSIYPISHSITSSGMEIRVGESISLGSTPVYSSPVVGSDGSIYGVCESKIYILYI